MSDSLVRRAVKVNVGGTDILIEVIQPEPIVEGGKGFRPVGIDDAVQKAYSKLHDALIGLSTEISGTVQAMTNTPKPQKLEVEVGLSFSAQTGIWLLTAKGEGSIKVKMTWDKL